MAQRKTTKKAAAPVVSNNMRGVSLAAMIVGIVGVVFFWIPFWGSVIAAAALALGIVALAKRAPRHGMALAGTILGGVGTLLSILVAIVLIGLALTAPTPQGGDHHAMPQYIYN